MSGQITLNKQNGGQLTLEPENNAVNKTITIPDVGVGKVLGTKTFKQNTPVQRSLSSVSLTISDLESNYADLGGTSSVTYNKISDSSILIIQSVVHIYTDHSGSANKWSGGHQRILANGTQVATTVEAPGGGAAYGIGWNTVGTNSNGRSMGYSTLVGQISGISSGSVDIRIQGTAGTSNTTLYANFNYYGNGSITVTEVAA